MPQEESFSVFDAIVILTDHAELPLDRIALEARCVLDARGVLHSLPTPGPHLHSL